MKIVKYFTSVLLASVLVINISSCQNNGKSETGGKLAAATFSEQIKTDSFAQIIDVRTPNEYAEGYIAKAINIDWNGNTFEADVAKLDKAKPTYVYCLAGGRSASAASKLKELGFTNIHELKGGMNAWRNAALPIEMPNDAAPAIVKTGMSLDSFTKQINENNLVMVDVFAVWCGPCKKMAPYLAEIALEKKDKLVFLKIDADENQEIVKRLNVEELPTIILYKNGKRVYTNIGLISKADLLKAIDDNGKK